ncbi:MAG TPA: hotdog domain-containing protein [Candidatus Acidoferrales bacterium]|jgi:predicted thioesterase|nr:hotdog domain-containing protein [Candidatus Acidoferrales bacterium]
MTPPKKRGAKKPAAKKASRQSRPKPSTPTGKAAPSPLEFRPPLGLEATIERVVLPEHTIQHVNPNLPPVFSTPSMIGLMEHATVQAVLPKLPPGFITVGTRIEVDHLKAVPDGATVHAHAKLVGYKGRFLIFDVEARSGEHIIGRGRVFRAVVDPQTHKTHAQARLQFQ